MKRLLFTGDFAAILYYLGRLRAKMSGRADTIRRLAAEAERARLETRRLRAVVRKIRRESRWWQEPARYEIETDRLCGEE